MSSLVVRPLTPERVDDFLRFFDHQRGPAFADNPEWAKCYCHFYQVPRAIDWPSLPGAANRVAMRSRTEAGASEAAAEHYHGPLSMFLAAGFAILRDVENMTVVRKLL